MGEVLLSGRDSQVQSRLQLLLATLDASNGTGASAKETPISVPSPQRSTVKTSESTTQLLQPAQHRLKRPVSAGSDGAHIDRERWIAKFQAAAAKDKGGAQHTGQVFDELIKSLSGKQL